MISYRSKLVRLTNSDYTRYLFVPILKVVLSLLAVVPLTTYYLTPEDIGLYALITALVLPISGIGAAGPRWFIGGHYNETSEQDRGVLVFNVLLFESLFRGALLLLVAMFVDPVLETLLENYKPDDLHLVHTALVAVAVHILWSPLSYLMTVRRDSYVYLALSLIQIFSNFFALVLFLWWMGLGVVSLFYALLLTNLVSLFFEFLYIRKKLRFRFSSEFFRGVWANQLHAIPGGMMEIISALVERFSIQHYLGIRSLGLYSHSQQYEVGIKMANGALTNAVTPRTLEVYLTNGDTTRIEDVFVPWYGLLGCVGVFVALFSDEVVGYLTHGKFAEAAFLVPIWFLMIYSVAHAIPYAQFLVARKQRKTLMYSQTVPAFAGVFILILGAWLGSVAYVAVAVVATNASTQLWRYIVSRQQGFKPVGNVAMAISLSAYLLVWLFEYAYQPSTMQEILVAGMSITILVVKFRLPMSLKPLLNI